MSLREKIVETIRREGPIPFSRYMAMCLYEPGLGYYARPREQFGKAGDFYTSSDVHAVYGRLMCRGFDEMWRALGSPSCIDLIELGPGRGLFALDVLDWAGKKFPDFAAALHYKLVETSEYLRTRQRERLADHMARGTVEVFSTLEEAAASASESVIVFGNEFFDALPVEVLTTQGQLYIGVNGAGDFVQIARPASTQVLEFVDRFSVHPSTEPPDASFVPPSPPATRVEATLESLSWMERIARVFEHRRGFAVFVDYGYTRDEQLAGRHLDTIMTYRQHTASPNFFEAPGEQDITAHVNFTALRAVAEQRGLAHLALTTQAEMLMGIGSINEFADAFADTVLPQERAKVMMQLKHLVTPAGIGEIFHAMTLAKGAASKTARQLSALKFAGVQREDRQSCE